MNVIMYERAGHTWVFLYRDDQIGEVLRKLGQYSCREDCVFSWEDARRVALKMRTIHNVKM